MKQIDFSDLVTLNLGQGHWKWYEMVEMDGAYEYTKYERILFQTLHAMSNNEVFAMKDGPSAGQPKICSAGHMAKKWSCPVWQSTDLDISLVST